VVITMATCPGSAKQRGIAAAKNTTQIFTTENTVLCGEKGFRSPPPSKPDSKHRR
jgi:hypothetical protein